MRKTVLILFGFMVSTQVGISREIPNANKTNGSNNGGASLKTVEELCQPAGSEAILQLNNVRTTILAGGDMWWDLNQARYEVPKGSNRHSMFAGALWLGGIDDGDQLKLAGMTYRQRGNDFWPGPLSTDNNATVTKDVCDAYDQHFRINRTEVEVHKAWLECQDDPDCDVNVNFPGYDANIPQSILEWPGNGLPSHPYPGMLAPFNDLDGDLVYDPYVDYPAYDIDNVFDCRNKETDVLYGDETLWWVYNDKGNIHTETQSGALGFEIRAQAFAFATNDEINNMTFYNYRIINRSSFRLADTYFSTWFDPDLGNANDDIIGCDIPRGLGYCYNSDADDEGPLGYGINPPAVGFDFFQGPFADYFDGIDNDRDGCPDAVKNEDGICVAENPALGINERIIMSGFMYFNNTSDFFSGNPENGTQFYNYMRSLWKNGDNLYVETPSGPGNVGNGDGLIVGGGGGAVVTKFAYPGVSYDTTLNQEPSAPQNWYESPANKEDKRGLHSAGPFSLAPGSINFITTGIVWERDINNSDLFASVEKVIAADDKAQALFDNCFQVLNGPDAPNLEIQELSNELIIKLDNPVTSNNYQLTYRELDPLIPLPVDPNDTVNNPPNRLTPSETDARFPNYRYYNFEGYQIFQLENANVSISDLYDPTQARLVAQSDVKNGLTQLINWEVDPALNALVPQDMTIETNNNGLESSIRLTQDAFATGERNLVNNREYFYTVIAYGVNEYQKFDPTLTPDGQRKPYLPGRRNIRTYSAVPHNPTAEANGTVANSTYGYGPEITRIEGRGNGNIVTDLKPDVEAEILANGFVEMPTYQAGKGPVNIKVIDPLEIPDGDYILEFDAANSNASWTVYNSTSGEVLVGKSDTTISLKNEQIIPELGMSVTIEQPLRPGNDTLGLRNNGVLLSEIIFENPTQAWLTGVSDVDDYNPLNWILSGTNDNATNPPAEYFPDFGGDPKGNYKQIVGGTWGPAAYVSSFKRETKSDGFEMYGLGPMLGYRRPIENCNSIDVVFTSDASKWTRVPVFELGEEASLNEGGVAKLQLRSAPGLDKDPSNPNMLIPDPANPGWSWFPGYAIDVETGVRLNMAFGENSWLASQNGRDMKWNPTANLFQTPGDNINGQYVLGGQHYIYVFGETTPFGLQTKDIKWVSNNPQDHPLYAELTSLSVVTSQTRVFRGISWVNIPLTSPGFGNLDPYSNMPSDVRVKIRMAKPYSNKVVDNSNGGNPKFLFTTSNIATSLNNLPAAESALDIIRVVPNPYYGGSQYEASQLDNAVKITNLPEVCTISIYSTNGTLIRQIKKDTKLTEIVWDLKNTYNVPIASGVYLFHIDAPGIGEKVVKWYGALRPVDLNAF